MDSHSSVRIAIYGCLICNCGSAWVNVSVKGYNQKAISFQTVNKHWVMLLHVVRYSPILRACMHLCVSLHTWRYVRVCACVRQRNMASTGWLWQFQLGPGQHSETTLAQTTFEGRRYTAVIMASLKTRSPSPPVFWREHMFACLNVCQQPPLQWQRPKRAPPRAPRGGEFSRQAGQIWRLISQQCTGVVSL